MTHHVVKKRIVRSLLFSLFPVLILLVLLYSCKSRVGKVDASTGTDNVESESQAQGDALPKKETRGEKPASGKAEPVSKEARRKPDGKEENGGIPVEVSEIMIKDISSYISSTTNIEAENETTILAEVDGRVMEIYKEEGDYVKKGELLAKLDDSERLIILKKARVKADNEETNCARSRELHSQNLLSPEAFDSVRYKHDLAMSELEEAEYNLSKTKIVAPFTGKVTARFIKIGQNIRQTDRLFTITNFNPLVANIYLPEKDALSLRVGQDVQIFVPWDGTRRYTGSIERISPVVDPQTGTVKITIYARNLPELIKPGSFVNINIVREVHSEAMLIPKRAVIKNLQEDFVFVVDGEQARRMKVKLGFEDNGNVEVLSGLNRAQKVISVGQGGLKDGTKIKIVQG
ncbi:MAG: efflux RND transporter periplasmic adaptor subunit [Acidobacteriota bacterium]